MSKNYADPFDPFETFDNSIANRARMMAKE
jgi:hypothetical protein